MARIAIISDPHANLHALDATLADMEGQSLDETWCLGDLVGYGPDPGPVAERVHASCQVVLAGNHDRLCTHGDTVVYGGEFGHALALARRDVHRIELSPWLAKLEPQAERHGIQLYHGSPHDPLWGGVQLPEAHELLADPRGPCLTVVGHTHEAAFFLREQEPGRPVAALHTESFLSRGVVLPSSARAILNPGSVGRPEDEGRDWRATYLILDTEARRATWHYVPYDLAAFTRRARDRGVDIFAPGGDEAWA